MIGQPLPYVLHTRHILLVGGQVLDDHGHAGVLGFSSKFVIMVEVVDGDSMWTNVVGRPCLLMQASSKQRFIV